MAWLRVLGSLRPGMVYVGGTDNGRWIPELLNDTSQGERHVILTQNGLADGAGSKASRGAQVAGAKGAGEGTAMGGRIWAGGGGGGGGIS